MLEAASESVALYDVVGVGELSLLLDGCFVTLGVPRARFGEELKEAVDELTLSVVRLSVGMLVFDVYVMVIPSMSPYGLESGVTSSIAVSLIAELVDKTWGFCTLVGVLPTKDAVETSTLDVVASLLVV